MLGSMHNPSALLKRVFGLSDFSPLILCIDGIGQTAEKLINEMVLHAKNSSDAIIVFVSFETVNIPSFAAHFIEADLLKLEKVIETINSYLPSSEETGSHKHLVVIDAINYIPREMLSKFVSSIASRYSTLVAIYHDDLPEYQDARLEHYPSSLELLRFMATSLIEVSPILPQNISYDHIKEELSRSLLPRGMNNDIFNITLTNRRKSGRSLTYNFQIDSKKHVYDFIPESVADNEITEETPELLQDLTTFNLGTSAKQKLAREQVDLPFLEAQSFNSGGAIVYQFEKDDDYDEEDPYEDPF